MCLSILSMRVFRDTQIRWFGWLDNAKLELFLTMLVIPLIINIFIFWMTDNFLMFKNMKKYKVSIEGEKKNKIFFKIISIKPKTIHPPNRIKNWSLITTSQISTVPEKHRNSPQVHFFTKHFHLLNCIFLHSFFKSFILSIFNYSNLIIYFIQTYWNRSNVSWHIQCSIWCAWR